MVVDTLAPRGEHIDPDDFCVIAEGFPTGGGRRGVEYPYIPGQFDGKRVSVARFMTGAPKGMVVDHLCRNIMCIRVDHLDVVKQGENIRRGIQGANANPNCRRCGANDWYPMRAGTTRRCRPCTLRINKVSRITRAANSRRR